MDDLEEISKFLKEPHNKKEEKEKIFNNLKLHFIEISEEIENKEKDFQFTKKNKITKYEKLLNQVNTEIISNNNLYLQQHKDFMFPKALNELNICLNKHIEDYNEKKRMIDEKKKNLNESLNTLKNYIEKMENNNKILNSKNKKISNNSEILAVSEKKKNFYQIKKKTLMRLKK